VTTITSPEGSGLPRVGFVVGRQVGSAVERNRAKRRLREAMARLTLEQDTTYVVIAGGGVNEAGFDRLVEWLREAVAAGSGGAHEEDE
jgi:ribonuclease P protein component